MGDDSSFLGNRHQGMQAAPQDTLLMSMHFRDGDHSGEAPLSEIIEGFDDGELSELCEIFDPTLDKWVALAEFLERSGSLAFSETKKMVAANEVDGTSGRQTDTIGTARTEETDVNSDFYAEENTPLFKKNDEKKPARYSTEWGKGHFHPVQPVSVVANGCGPSSNCIGPPVRTKKVAHVKPPSKLMRVVTQAMLQWDMLEEGDRLLLGLSGGKDSLSLLHVLLEFQRKLPIRFEIEVKIGNIMVTTPVGQLR